MVNITQLKEGNFNFVREEMASIMGACREVGVISKVIFKNCYLIRGKKLSLYVIAREARPGFIKTSTVFGTRGATFKDVERIRVAVGGDVHIKATGGIRNLETALGMIDRGVSRIGSTASVTIVEELKALACSI